MCVARAYRTRVDHVRAEFVFAQQIVVYIAQGFDLYAQIHVVHGRGLDYNGGRSVRVCLGELLMLLHDLLKVNAVRVTHVELQAFFFGREVLVQRACLALRRRRFVVGHVGVGGRLRWLACDGGRIRRGCA